ncbi:MAG TPA: hypothetical protein DCY42_06550 [Chloroflexi bacterium]|nr:hypothetical protein [Chloroflexota bacterium]
MKLPAFFVLIFTGMLVIGCSNQIPPQPATPTPPVIPIQAPETANADILHVRAVEEQDRTWTFHVTVSHPDTGWEDYADGWDIVLPDGTAALPDPTSPFTRLLTHPHENEQPFTRSQSGIVLPPEVKFVTVRAHDLVHGFGGQEVTVFLDQANGLSFEVERQDLAQMQAVMGLTQQRLDGNRFQAGQIDLLSSQPLDIPLAGIPAWVVGTATEYGVTFWVAALQDGRIQAFQVGDQGFQSLELSTSQLPGGMPPALLLNEQPVILNSRAQNLAEFSHPIQTETGSLAFISSQGELVISGKDPVQTDQLDALLDGRILSDGRGQFLLLSNPSASYAHGVLGDSLEAKSVSLLDASGALLQKITIPGEQVIEGIAPIWADLDNDGLREIILTLSDRKNGAQLAVYSELGEVIALGESIGTGYRWRHQIAAAPFGPNREVELVDVLTPHLGGVVEFFQLQGAALVKVAEVPGYTSHVINSRNLDMAAAGDFNADGRVELLLPNQNLTELGLIQRNANGAEVLANLPLAGHLTSNLALVPLPGGQLAVAAGMDSSILRIWLP